MKKSLLQRFIELIGFSIVGLFFFVWFLGNQSNNGRQFMSTEVLRGEVTSPSSYSNHTEDDQEDIVIRSSDYSGSASTYQRPKSVSGKARTVDYTEVKELSSRKRNKTTSDYTRNKMNAQTVRSWKGSHRDESFAWLCYERFGKDVVNLSNKHGLYPEVLMARIVAYSYEYTTNPKKGMADNNFTAMRKPKAKERAKFRSAHESLKAYALVNAGEVNRLSSEGAVAKHDRAWTMRKIIERYEFISDLSSSRPKSYKGKVGVANKISKEDTYKHEYAGEAMKMTSSVERKVKKTQSKRCRLQ